jgi:lysophospholipase L1-like esterase
VENAPLTLDPASQRRTEAGPSSADAGAPKRRLPRWKKLLYGLGVNLAVLAALAALGEVALRRLAPQSDYQVLDDDAMTLHQFADDIYLGFELRGGVRDHNELGFRGPARAVEKPPGVRRIAVVGDSVPYGLGVRADEAFPALLESLLEASSAGPVEVLNFGTPGYNSFQAYRLLQRRVLAFEPDLVLMVFSPDDVETSPVVINIDGNMCLFHNQFEGSALLNNRVHWGLFRRSHLYRFLYRRAVMAFATPGGRFDEVSAQPEVAWANVERAAALCAARGVAFRLVLSPMLTPYYRPPDPPDGEPFDGSEMLLAPGAVEQHERSFARIRQLAAEGPVEVIDLGPLYDRHGAAMKLAPIDHEHLGPAGHRLVAQRLAEEVEP